MSGSLPNHRPRLHPRMSSTPLRHSDSLLIAWRLAEFEATNRRATGLEPVHFFLALLKVVEIDLETILGSSTALTGQEILREAGSVKKLAACFAVTGLETTQTRRGLRRLLPMGSSDTEFGGHLRRTPEAREAFEKAEQEALKAGAKQVETLHLLAGILAVSCPLVQSALDHAGIDEEKLARAVAEAMRDPGSELGENPSAASPITTPWDAPLLQKEKERGKDKNRERDKDVEGRRPRAGGVMERLGRDLTDLARQGKLAPVIGRKDEMRSLIQTLLRSRKSNAILIGEAGVGKTGIVEGLAQRIVEGAVPADFASRRIVEVSMGSLVAGTSYRGDMEARLQALIAEAKRDPNLILFIDEIHLLVGAGQSSGSSMDAANLLKPALARGEVCVIGATTTREYRKFIETDAALARRFEVIEVLEPSRQDAIAILEGLRSHMESHHGVKIADDALAAAVDFTVRYLPAHRLPDKAIDVLDQACAQARLQSLSGDLRAKFKTGQAITRKDVAAAVAHRCKVPVGDLAEDEPARLLRLESDLEKRVKGQPRAIHALSEAIRLARSGLKKGGRPIGVFLFVGPSGTGKTELAKSLAECLFGDENQLIRLDMSEFMEEHSVSKLIGSPPGFVGHGLGGQLTEKIRSRPHCVLLLDEVEKAHPRVMDLFLQVFDHGFLTDSHGVACDFRETIIILTSNIGAGETPAIGFFGSTQTIDRNALQGDAVMGAVKRTFRPELINRFTEIVIFQPLGSAEVKLVLGTIIDRLNARLSDKSLHLELTPEAENVIVAEGYSSEYGVRHLERAVERLISKPLAELILSGQAPAGSRLRCEIQSGKLMIQRV